MATTPRDRARERFSSRCGYCGVSEVEVGATLTIDHHRPRSRGGSEDDENLVYACPRCNEHKGSYWHAVDPPHTPLLHPGRDDLTDHVREGEDGRLVGLTSAGSFFIEKLRLNRRPLVARRLERQAAAERERAIEAARERMLEQDQRIARARAALDAALEEIRRLSTSRNR